LARLRQTLRRRRRLKASMVLLAGAAVAAVLATAFSSSAPAQDRAARHPPAVRRLRAARLRSDTGRLRPGTVVNRKRVGERIFADGRHGFALGWVSSTLVPVSTRDGGRLWRIDGPRLYREAADAPAAISNIGLVVPRMFYAYGPSVVDVTPDGGPGWWQTFFDGFVVAVVPGSHVDLVAYVQPFQSRANPRVTYQYVTRDGGRHWQYATALAGG
jgi:hypothetical protein